MSSFGFRKPDDLPVTIPVFPLTGAVLFPRSALPLNIFEPRYLNMIDDALASDRLIGMIQPAAIDDAATPRLSAVGCAGKITTFSETEDGRYLITLTGVCRFRVDRELAVQSPYRKVAADWRPFAADLSERDNGAAIDQEILARALRDYASAKGFQVDWEAATDAPAEMLVNAVCAACPFDPVEKQLLLEADTLADRCDALVTLLELGAHAQRGGTLQ
ncbi:MAG: LON peptidase substrate-binding domain-containing protein [Hyphomonadaceae bacterium]|nr:MAG: ATP-dependent La family protease [Caulobacteraceae bacterium]MBT9446080.1 LON peptidase substrate-binding domain-containing protein [Hyphomonadaceae bacterium]TPW03635.1 MAG: ATP-dependent La family protease [Alphaproteobacteria bacterium]